MAKSAPVNIGFQWTPIKMFAVVASAVAIIIGLATSSQMIENVDADEIMVIQSPVSGKLTWYTTPGIQYQGFGRVTKYFKRSVYEFKIPVRFNDGGHATMIGSIQYEMPLDVTNLTSLLSI